MAKPISNDEIAEMLDRVAALLEAEGENSFRTGSYRQAAATLRQMDEPIAERIQSEGSQFLTEIPGIGAKLAGAIDEIVRTGRMALADRLESEVTPERVLTQAPGVGPKLAKRLHEQLGIRSLEELELAAHDGRLEQVEGVGDKRVRTIRESLAGMLSQSAQRRAQERTEEQPTVEEVLDVDAEYRRKASQGRLKKIAPRRFNPQGEAWLPILHTRRQEWSFTALYSNTARAHELGKTEDWVVIYHRQDGQEGQHTVTTATSGALAGKRVIRGRENECRRHYGL